MEYKNIAYIGGGLVLFLGLLALLWIQAAPPGIAPDDGNVAINTPSDISDMWKKPEKPTPPPAPVRDRSGDLTADDFFEKPKTFKRVDPYARQRAERKKLNALRRAVTPGGQFDFVPIGGDLLPDYGRGGWWNETSIGANPRKKKGENWVMEDKDFVGVGKDVASFPVDLTRTITVDQMFSALLINDLRSDLGGQVVAQISSPVYAAHGGLILIPAGSKAIGIYQPLVSVGDERLQLVWKRIITPSGISINVSAGESTDVMGRVGLTGEVDTRKSEKYRDALLVSLIPLSKAAGKISAGMMQEAAGIPPRITIKGGTRITINPTTDIWFKKPHLIGSNVVVKRANSWGRK